MARLRYLPLVVLITLIIILVLPIPLTICILPLVVYRWILSTIYTRIHADSVGILNLQGSLMCRLTRTCVQEQSDGDRQKWVWAVNNQNITSIVLHVTLEGGTLDIEEFRTLVTREVIQAKTADRSESLYAQLQQYPELWMGYLFWKRDTSFTIENHIKLYQNSDDWGLRDSEFCQKFVQNYRHSLLPPDRSPWEVTVIENVQDGLSSSPSTMIVFKFTHYFADGYSVYNAVTRLADGGSAAIKRHEPKLPSKFLRWFTGIAYLIRGPYDFVTASFTTGSTNFERRTLTAEDGAAPEGRSTILSVPLPVLNMIKRTAKKYQVSFSTVLLVCFGRGIRHHLLRHGGLSSEQIPKYLKTSFPFPSPYHAEGLTNDLYLASLQIPMHDAGFEMQLQEFEDQIRRIKRSTIPLTMKLIWCVLGILPPSSYWKYTIFGRFFKFDNLLSVFPGPREEFHIMGRHVVSMNYVAASSLLALPFSLAILTYNGAVQFWLTASPDIVPQNQMRNLAECIEHEFMALQSN